MALHLSSCLGEKLGAILTSSLSIASYFQSSGNAYRLSPLQPHCLAPFALDWCSYHLFVLFFTLSSPPTTTDIVYSPARVVLFKIFALILAFHSTATDFTQSIPKSLHEVFPWATAQHTSTASLCVFPSIHSTPTMPVPSSVTLNKPGTLWPEGLLLTSSVCLLPAIQRTSSLTSSSGSPYLKRQAQPWFSMVLILLCWSFFYSM